MWKTWKIAIIELSATQPVPNLSPKTEARPSIAIVWFRRDLRLTDNPSLRLALAHHDRIVPLFLADLEAELPWAPGAASRWWLLHSPPRLDRPEQRLSGKEGGWKCQTWWSP